MSEVLVALIASATVLYLALRFKCEVVAKRSVITIHVTFGGRR